jgi:hypothetical protein
VKLNDLRGNWFVAQTDKSGDIITSTRIKVTDRVLDLARQEKPVDNTEQMCAAEDVARTLSDEHGVDYTFWFS